MKKTKKVIPILLGFIIFIFGVFKIVNVYAKIPNIALKSDATLAEWVSKNPTAFVNEPTSELLGERLNVENVNANDYDGATIFNWWSATCVDPHNKKKTHSLGYAILSIIDISPDNAPTSVRILSRAAKKKEKILKAKDNTESVRAGFRLAYYINEARKDGLGRNKDLKQAIKKTVSTIIDNNESYFCSSYYFTNSTDRGSEKKSLKDDAIVYQKGVIEGDKNTFDEIKKQGSDTVQAAEKAVPIYQVVNGVNTIVGYNYYTMIGPMNATWKGGSFTKKLTINGNVVSDNSYKICKKEDGTGKITLSKLLADRSGKNFYIRYEGRLNAGDKVRFQIKHTGGSKKVIKARIVLLTNKHSIVNSTQNLGIFGSCDEHSTPQKGSATWKVNPSNKLKIIKRGKNGEALNGVTFKLYNSAGQEVGEKITEGNGEAIFENLMTDTYYAKEIYINPNISGTYSAHAQGQPESDRVEVSGDDDEEIEFCEMDNEQYTNLMINKKAKYQNRNVADARFKVQYSEDNVNWKWIDNYTVGKPSTVNFTFNEADADEYATGPDGNITFDNIPVGYYRVKEISVPEPLVTMPQKDNKRWVDDISESLECKPISDAYFDANGNTSRHDFIIYCEDPEIFKISGYVFTPTKATTKSEQGIGKRRSDYQSTDYVVKNATVTLYKKDENGNLVEYYGNALDGETENPVQLTGENGYYEYKVVKKSSDDNENIKPFAIKFTYDSIDFIAMSPHYTDPTAKQEKYSDLKEGATSKAEEEDDWEIRKRYTEIYGGTTPKEELKNGDTFKGKAKYQKERNKTDEENTELTYKWNEVTKDVSGDNIENPGTTGISESICQRNQTGYTTNDEKKYISINKEGKDIHKDNKIESTFYLDGTGKKDIYGKDGYNTIEEYSEITDGRLNRVNQINLGLVKREQPNLSVTNSLVNVNADINNYTNVYDTTITKTTNVKLPDGEKTSFNGTNDTLGQQVGVTYVNEGELSAFELYTSDARTISQANKSKIKEQLDRKLKLFVTYKIELINNSNSLYSKVNELALFHDENYIPITVSRVVDEYGKARRNTKLTDNYELEFKNTSDRRTAGHKESGQKYSTIYVDTSKIGDKSEGYIMPADDKNSNEKTLEEVYVTYQVADSEIETMLDKQEIGKKYVPQFRHIAEINSYTTFEKDAITKEKVLYSGIDKNSAPGNVPEEMTNDKIENKELRGQELRNELMKKRAENISKFDDDTGYAEEFTINFKDKERSLEGTVFRDKDSGYNIGQERKSNGEFDVEDTGLKNVTVKLIEANIIDENTGLIEIDNTTGKVKERDNSLLVPKYENNGKTNDNGNYKITEFIPGNFILEYTYDNNVTYTDTEGNPIQINALDYKSAAVSRPEFKNDNVNVDDNYNYTNSTKDISKSKWYTTDNPTADDNRENYQAKHRYSEAFDNWETRTKLDYQEMNYKTTDQNDKIDKTMDSYTPVFAVYVELNTQSDKNQYLPENYNIINMDFGITERAKQQMSISKRVSNIKITLPNGQVLLDGDPKEDKKMSGLKYLAPADGNNGTVNVELDSELIHGSTLELTHEITVNNESEKDYYNEGYYKFADNTNDLVTITPTVYDYVDNNLTFDQNNPEHNKKWTVIDKEKFVKENPGEEEVLVSENANKNIQSKNTIVKYCGEAFNATIPPDVNNEGKFDIELNIKGMYRTYLTLTRVLSNSDDDDLTYNNDIEINHGNKTGGRRILIQLARYMEENKGGIGASSETTTITPPTGEDKDYTIYIVAGLVSLLILASGIIIIKKKVLK